MMAILDPVRADTEGERDESHGTSTGITGMAVHRAASGRAVRGGGGRCLRPDDLLPRRVRGRRLEDERWRHDLAQCLGRLLHDGGDWRDCRLGVRPERRLCGHGRGDDPRQCLARRRRLQVHRWRQDVARIWASRQPATSAKSASTRRTRISSTSPPSATPGGRTRSAASTAPRTAARRGNWCCARATGPARTTSRWTRTTRASSTPRSGRRSATRTN